MDLVHETTAPLAWDHEQMPFQLPPEAVAWKVRVFTGKPGRPPAVYGEQGVLHLALDATVEDLRQAVKDDPGSYRLYPVDMNGNELTPIACMEIVEQAQPVTALDHIQPDTTATTAAMREMVLLCNKMVASRDSHDALLANVLNTLVATTATIQRSTAVMLNAASTTIKVANGVESLERQEPPPQLDVGELTEHLVDALVPDEPASKPGNPWYLQLLMSPVGMGILNNVNSFFSVMRENMVKKHEQEMQQAAAATQPVQQVPAQPVQQAPAQPVQTTPQPVQSQPVQQHPAQPVQAPPPARPEPATVVQPAPEPAPAPVRSEMSAPVRNGGAVTTGLDDDDDGDAEEHDWAEQDDELDRVAECEFDSGDSEASDSAEAGIAELEAVEQLAAADQAEADIEELAATGQADVEPTRPISADPAETTRVTPAPVEPNHIRPPWANDGERDGPAR